jgi:Bacteriophage Sf6, terminase small subunit-like
VGYIFGVDISDSPPRRGRPTIRSKEVENEICRRIACGESLRHLCLDPNMPCRDTVFRWLRGDQKRRLKLRALLSALQDEQLNKA